MAETVIPSFDTEVVKALELRVADLRSVHREWMQLGIRNETGQLYRIVGVAGGNAWLETLDVMRMLGFVNELDGSRKSTEGCDTIFFQRVDTEVTASSATC
ncbi:hypothetical protein [Cupriavidus consociatus]|uniref:hypothetical protein n=1 Tax=Cupriavidus consociatus TaxID=2821357 RepID=UPI001AE6A895|nr:MULTISPECIES: hypothetical protein [unclassified Cupriavidus]MBP0624722.1 hypothetical protein [Cupriavidus sp. LEh25]MDK2661434.1 hypothetical protein [Cupriavidus sp. LEh21]